MFNKKAKLVAAIGALSIASPFAAAVTFDWSESTFSAEGSADDATIAMPIIEVNWEAEYARDDIILMSFSADLAATFSPSSVLTAYAPCEVAGADQVGTADNNGGTITLGLISEADASLTYRVTEINYAAATATDGGACDTDAGLDVNGDAIVAVTSAETTIGALYEVTADGGAAVTFDGPSVTGAGTLTGTYSATLSNGTTPLDGGAQAMIIDNADPLLVVSELVSFDNQYTIDATANSALDGIINVSATPTRTRFSIDSGDGNHSLTVDAGTLGLEEVLIGGFALASAADNEVVTAIVTGDFSYILDEDDTTPATVDSNAWTMTVGGNAGVSVTYVMGDGTGNDTATFVGDAGDFGDLVFTYDQMENGLAAAAGTSTLVKGEYTVDVSVAYDTAAGADRDSSVVGSDLDAGEWTLNGSTSIVQAYPISSNVSNFLWVTNTGANPGDVTVVAIHEGVQTEECPAGTAAGLSLSSISPAVNACLAAAGITSGRAQLSITVNAAAADVDVYAGYKSNSADDRLGLNVE